MTQHDGISELDLLAYADGRLEPARAREVEAALAADPALGAKVADFARQNDELAAQYGAYAEAPLPERLARVLSGPAERPRPTARRRTLARAAALLVVALGAGAGGWSLGRMDARAPGGADGAVLASAAALHESGAGGAGARRTAADRTERADRSARPLDWFAERIALELTLPDLRDRGFALVAKRRVRLAGSQGVRLRYSAADGTALDVFLKSRWNRRTSPVATRRRGDVALAHWMDGPLSVVVAGDGDARGTVAEFANTLRARLRARHGNPAGSTPDLEPHGPDTPGRETVTRAPEVRPPVRRAPAGTDLLRPATGERR